MDTWTHGQTLMMSSRVHVNVHNKFFLQCFGQRDSESESLLEILWRQQPVWSSQLVVATSWKLKRATHSSFVIHSLFAHLVLVQQFKYLLNQGVRARNVLQIPGERINIYKFLSLDLVHHCWCNKNLNHCFVLSSQLWYIFSVWCNLKECVL